MGGKRIKSGDLTGRQFTYIYVIGEAPTEAGQRGKHWLCRCICGKEMNLPPSQLLGKRPLRSCGCKKWEIISEKATKSPYRTRYPREYSAWTTMRHRCNSPKSQKYHAYGARGIRVCERWASFESFLEDMGPRPGPDFSVDRKNNDGHYSCGHCEECLREQWPANCRWATRKEQANNTRRTVR